MNYKQMLDKLQELDKSLTKLETKLAELAKEVEQVKLAKRQAPFIAQTNTQDIFP